MKILIFGATGMLGNAMFRLLSGNPALTVYGTVRNQDARRFFSPLCAQRVITGIDVESQDCLVRAYAIARPNVVINCVGLVKQLSDANDPLQAVPLNTLLPHRLAALCQMSGSRLIHISTDCVFSGEKGNYLEADFPDAHDLYGRSKFLGEVDYPHAITLRTSIIGHELSGSRSLIGWFLAQQGSVKGYKKAIFSGLPTVELAGVVLNYVLPNPALCGLFHVAADPINKYELLRIVAAAYAKDIEIVPEEEFIIDRSLDATRFTEATGYRAPAWPVLIQRMQEFK